jgi:epoxyqueuosine reductase
MNLELLKQGLGLTAIGIAPAHGLDDEYARLLDWLSRGYHGSLSWLAKGAKKRCDPSHVLAEPKSVVVCAMKYEDMPKRDLKSQISDSKSEIPRYLRHEDYHTVMMKKLEAAASALKAEYPDMRYKCYVDTGPVLEKAWGVRAGLGFIGKNTLLISPEHGSQMALGVAVTNAPSPPAADPLAGRRPSPSMGEGGGDDINCASCTACLDACPTKALVAPYLLDARKCISYKCFIEKKEGGCDICQDVCPFNKEDAHG